MILVEREGLKRWTKNLRDAERVLRRRVGGRWRGVVPISYAKGLAEQPDYTCSTGRKIR